MGQRTKHPLRPPCFGTARIGATDTVFVVTATGVEYHMELPLRRLLDCDDVSVAKLPWTPALPPKGFFPEGQQDAFSVDVEPIWVDAATQGAEEIVATKLNWKPVNRRISRLRYLDIGPNANSLCDSLWSSIKERKSDSDR